MSHEQYVDMDRNNRQHHHPTNSMSSAASSCSITSGTPSTDMRFAEYHLEKVIARFTPDEEEQRFVFLLTYFTSFHFLRKAPGKSVWTVL